MLTTYVLISFVVVFWVGGPRDSFMGGHGGLPLSVGGGARASAPTDRGLMTTQLVFMSDS